MKKERKYYNLDKIGYREIYLLFPNGMIFNNLTNKFLKADKNFRFSLKNKDNKYKTVSLKTIYRKVYNKEFCFDNIKNFDNEIWKEINETKGKYFISNYGRIKTYCGYNAKILKQFKTKKNYNTVNINKKHYKIHRLVAYYFISTNLKENEVHHIDGNTFNNKVDNLEILSAEQHRKKHNKK